jgi:DNA polymerase
MIGHNSIENIKKSVINCEKCGLHKIRNNPVVGEGALNSSIMFIGEAPGKNEDNYGKPFIGRAGKIFEDMLFSIQLKREDVYITNIIKCRPPKNRNPSKSEISICSQYIDKQIKLINPKLIVPLGRIAISYIFEKFEIPFEKINSIHGKVFSKNNLKIIPIYHPAAIIYNNKLYSTLLNDFNNIRKHI